MAMTRRKNKKPNRPSRHQRRLWASGCCQFPGCWNPHGIPCWLPGHYAGEGEPDFYYCAKHCQVEGFCWACGTFWAGVEDFDFDPRGLCSNCRDDPDYNDDLEYDEGMDLGYFPFPEGIVEGV